MAAAGPFLEDFQVNQVVRHWPGRTIRDFDDTWFSMMTMNGNPVHFDDAYGARSQHGQCLVNGMLVLSLAVGMSSRDLAMSAIANLALDEVRHLAPVFHGDTIYALSTVLDVRQSKSKPDRGILSVETRAVNQHERDVLSFTRKLMLPTRPDGAGGGAAAR